MSNPLLDDVKNSGTVETVSIALPTMGRFYEDGVLDENSDPGDLVINSLGIMAELSTRDPFILASGKGMELLIPQVCPAINQPSKLAEIDLEAILLAARIATHGNKMTLEHQCTNTVQEDGDEEEKPCGEKNKIEVNLYDIIQRYGPIEFSDKFVVDLPEYNQKVFLRPIEYGQALAILKEALTTNKETEEMSTTKVADLLIDEHKIDEYSTMIAKQAVATMESIIHSIFYVEAGNGGKVFDRDSIKEWLLAISKDNVKKIVNQAGTLSESFYGNNSITYKCAGCGKENKTSIELDIQKLFFFTPQDSNQPKKPSNTSKTRGQRKTIPSRTLPK